MKIVIISRCIYPAIAPRAFRATELGKYFAKQGHDVFQYAVVGNYDYREYEKSTGVKVCSLGKMHFSTLNSDEGSKARNNFFDKIARRLLGRCCEYPDIELMWKTKRVLGRLNNIDLLITVAIPYPIHWGAAWAKKCNPSTFPKVWISDCGDPYMGNSVDHSHPAYFQKMEDFWGKMTDYIAIPLESARGGYSEKVQSKIRIIPQGFDFDAVELNRDFKPNNIVKFAYAGLIYPGYRDPSKMLDFLSSKKNIQFQFIVYTKSKQFFEKYKSLLGEKLIIRDFIPREQLLQELSQMDFLVNLKNNSQIQSPSKLIDYYLTGRPIIDISTNFDEFDILNEFLECNYTHCHVKTDISQYDIHNVGALFWGLVKDDTI